MFGASWCPVTGDQETKNSTAPLAEARGFRVSFISLKSFTSFISFGRLQRFCTGDMGKAYIDFEVAAVVGL
jgi:hypothetical protein